MTDNPHSFARDFTNGQIAAEVLLERNQISLTDLSNQLAMIAEHQIDFADIYLQFDQMESWSLDEAIVKNGHFSIEQGIGVRAIHGEKTAFAYADDISLTSIQQAAQTVRNIAKAGKNKRLRIPTALTHKTYTPIYGAINPTNSLATTEKIDLLHKIDQLGRNYDPRVVQVMASLVTDYNIFLVANTLGNIACDVRPLVRVSMTVFVEQNGRRESNSSGGGGRTTLALFDDAYLEKMVKDACDGALINLEAKPAPAGTMTVVLGPGWPGVLLHEAVGHGLEGDFNRKGSSAFSQAMGQQIAAKGVTVIDDGTLPNLRGSLNIDDEGNPSKRNLLIEDGILVGYLHDYLSSKLMKVPPTGNGRRESYASPPLPRMTNTFMLAGKEDPQAIIASVKDGIYASNFGGGQVDITNGKFVFSASVAWKIENGQLKYPIKGATIAGHGPESLRYITMIGNDLALDKGVGVCGKEGQSVPVGVGQPTLRIENLTVGGTQ